MGRGEGGWCGSRPTLANPFWANPFFLCVVVVGFGGREREKKSAKFWGPPTVRPHHPSGPHPLGPTTSGPHFFWVWPFGHHDTKKLIGQKLGWPKIGLALIGQNWVGQKEDWPKSVSSVVCGSGVVGRGSWVEADCGQSDFGHRNPTGLWPIRLWPIRLWPIRLWPNRLWPMSRF